MSSNARTVSLAILIAASLLVACSRAKQPAEPVAAAPAAPPPAETAPAATVSSNVKAFEIGGLSALALKDGSLELPNDNKVFGVGRTPEEVAAVLGAAGQSTDKLQLSIQPLLVKATDRVLLFDTGAGSNFGPSAGQLAGSLAEANVDPASVTDIFISHVHGDHIGGLVNAQGALAFPNATIHLSKPEWKYLSDPNADFVAQVGAENVAAFLAAVKPKILAFEPGSDLVPGVVKAVEVKGHTPGHSAYLIGAGSDSLLYVGDSMHHFVVSVQKPEWSVAFDGDKKTAAASRAALIAQSAADGQRIYAVHFPFPGLGKFQKSGAGFAWVAE